MEVISVDITTRAIPDDNASELRYVLYLTVSPTS
jgi:hypothetical protein